MKVITQVHRTENVAIISFEKANATIGFLADLFDRVAKAQINVDMISQTAPKSDSNSISFTVSDERVTDILAIVTALKQEYPGLIPLVSPGNVKLCLYGEAMPGKVGVASDAFLRLNQKDIDILLITTSDMDISLVVTAMNSDLAYNILREAYLG